MPRFKKGDMWDAPADVWCVTTNNVISRRNGGELVMGAGVARQASRQNPGLAALACRKLRTLDTPHRYGFLLLPQPFSHIALFQTKYHFLERSPLELIRYSVAGLSTFATDHPKQRIALPYPGIGYGGLDPSLVKPMLNPLPDNVTVYQL